MLWRDVRAEAARRLSEAGIVTADAVESIETAASADRTSGN